MAAANADLTLDVPFVVENLVLAKNTTADIKGATQLLSGAGVPVKGVRLVKATFDIAALTAAVTTQLQEFALTDVNSLIRIAVGDLFLPFGPAIGTGVNQLNATIAILPAVAQTIDKIPVLLANLTAAATDPASGTFTFLWVKVN